MRFENLCSTVQLNGWQAMLDDSSESGQDHWERAHLRSLWLYRAVVKGDTRGLRTLLKRNYIDVDVFYNVSREELEWQTRSETTFGPSGNHLRIIKISYRHIGMEKLFDQLLCCADGLKKKYSSFSDNI